MERSARRRRGDGNDGGLAPWMSAGLWPTAACLAIYCLISIAARAALPDALTLDEAEQSLFSQYWLLGYGPQPPLFNWVQNAVVDAMGLSMLSLAVPKFAILFLAYLFFGLAAREIDRRPTFVSFAMLSLILLPQVSYMPQQDLTHTVAVLMATALFFYGLCRALQRGDFQGYAITGVAIGLGIISKYNFVLLPAAAIFAVFLERPWRARLFNPRLVLTIAIAVIIVLPHAVWLLSHVDLATRGTIGKMVDANAAHGLPRIARALVSLLLACLAFSGLALAVLGLTFRRDVAKAYAVESRWTRLLGRTMLFSLAGVVVVILATGTSKITERWLDPYLLVLPLYLLAKLGAAEVEIGRPLQRLVPVLLVLMLVTLIPSPLRVWTAGLTGSVSRINMPFSLLAEKIRGEGEPAVIVARGMHLAGNMRMQFPRAAVIDWEADERSPLTVGGRSPVLVIEAYPDGRMPAAEPVLPPYDGLAAAPAQTLTLPYAFEPRKQMGFRYGWLR